MEYIISLARTAAFQSAAAYDRSFGTQSLLVSGFPITYYLFDNAFCSSDLVTDTVKTHCLRQREIERDLFHASLIM